MSKFNLENSKIQENARQFDVKAKLDEMKLDNSIVHNNNSIDLKDRIHMKEVELREAELRETRKRNLIMSRNK
jgi:hypothetical protein